MKFDSIFDSLGPVGGILTGDKVKPVLLNSKLPVDILGRVWDTHTHTHSYKVSYRIDSKKKLKYWTATEAKLWFHTRIVVVIFKLSFSCYTVEI